MQSRPVLYRQKHILHINKCGNLMLTLRSCLSKKKNYPVEINT